MLHLLRASAGAGKTHRLVQIYLSYILGSRERIPRVLVLSFTNKATQELKQRILGELHALSRGEGGAMGLALQEILGCDEVGLRERAEEALGYLLNHYDAFAVCTVDTFFQQVLRAFSYELGIPSHYELWLTQHQLVDDAVQALLEQLPHHGVWQATLVDLAMEKIEEGRAWQLTKVLRGWGEDLVAGWHEGATGGLGVSEGGEGAVIDVLARLSREGRGFVEGLADRAGSILREVEAAGWAVEDFAWGRRGVMGFLEKCARKDRPKPPSGRIVRASEDPTVWGQKKGGHYGEVVALAEARLQPLLHELLTYHRAHYTKYETTQALLSLRYRLVTTQALRALMEAYMRTRGGVLIDTVPQLIQQVSEEDGLAFWEAKTGMSFAHVLVDESQDLATGQWQALAPLVGQRVREGYDSWLVGDAKQAIYRWRGGNPQLLLTQVAEDMGQERTVASDLAYNWRSEAVIVRFNNAFFGAAAELVATALQEEASSQAGLDTKAIHDAIAHIPKAYAQVVQKLPTIKEKANGGYVQVRFVNTEAGGGGWKAQAMAEVIEAVERLQAEGYAPQDMALLVRNNAEARSLLEALATHQQSEEAKAGVCYDAVASASLALAANPHVRLLVHALQYVRDGGDRVALAALVHLYETYVKGALRTGGQEGGDGEVADQRYWLGLDDVAGREAYLPKAFWEGLEGWKRLPLYPLVGALVGALGLTGAADGAYLAAFQEVVHRFTQGGGKGLTDFLGWWEGYGQHECKVAPAFSCAVSIMTIHQAKGLAFKAVLVPFCAWDLDHPVHRPPVIAGETSEPPFDGLGVVPLTYRSQLKETYYGAAYAGEKWAQHLEQLNLLYVALTRAKEVCYVWAPYVSTGGVKTTAHVLNHLLCREDGAVAGQGTWDEGSLTWHAGRLPKGGGRWVAPTQLRARGGSVGWAPAQYKQVMQRVLATHAEGVWWHALLGEITTVDSVEGVLKRCLQTGQVSEAEAASARTVLGRLFADARVQAWFSGAWEVHAERTIVLPSGALYRPDRVMTHSKKAVVVDFKLGRPSGGYRKQVRTYMDLMGALGYAEVEGYLLYLPTGEVVAVT